MRKAVVHAFDLRNTFAKITVFSEDNEGLLGGSEIPNKSGVIDVLINRALISSVQKDW